MNLEDYFRLINEAEGKPTSSDQFSATVSRSLNRFRLMDFAERAQIFRISMALRSCGWRLKMSLPSVFLALDYLHTVYEKYSQQD